MSPRVSERSMLARRLSIAIAVPVLLLLVLGLVLGRQILEMSEASDWVDHTDEVISVAHDTLRQIVDQETGVRGFIITENRIFLDPYEKATPTEGFARLHALVGDNANQQARFDAARAEYDAWSLSVAPIVAGHLETARATMIDRRARMNAIRAMMREAIAVEERLRRERVTASEQSTKTTRTAFVLLFIASAIVLAFFSRRQLSSIAATFGKALEAETEAREATETEAWIRTGQAKLAETMQGERTVDQLGADCLAVLATATKADVGAFFTKEGAGWRRRAGFAIDAKAGGERFGEGEGIVGRAAVEKKLVHVTDAPPDYLKLRSGTGEATPNELVLVPACVDGAPIAVIELGFLRPISMRALGLLERASETIGLGVRSSEYKAQLRELLEEAQRQAEELQAQQEELRVANEELEAHTTAMKGTQEQLRTQQAELEQTNEDLVRQTKLLEYQNRRLDEARTEIATKAVEVERASQFKSEFLSNMSHELRTPLNSTLILAKLLADNKSGNLTAEQVKFAQTIHDAGNDLLLLISDILDLSKIEAGKMDVHAAPLPLDRLGANLTRLFTPIASEKKLTFSFAVDRAVPPVIETDGPRLEQILKNLVSNALKFTERGEVSVRVTASEGDAIAFAIRDTGIGIPDEQQEMVFEAFRQADGNTNRKYGGTGLGLSISRQLARLLGGDITLASRRGEGSTFTVTLPRIFHGPHPALATDEMIVIDETSPRSLVAARAAKGVASARHDGPATASERSLDTRSDSRLEARPSARPSEPAPESETTRRVRAAAKVVLVVEDDDAFAKILVDVAREAGFECLVTDSAQRGFELARKHLPTGIILDMKLPDFSGLSVLERLKRDPSTRHIPVHVVSGADFTEAALAMGAATYLLKPTSREQLLEAIQKLEARAAKRMRRVLVVDDDEQLRESVAKLLGRSDVEIRTAGTVSEALGLLRERTFDCVVTDLALGDQTAHELLETMAKEEPYSVPPVIVYTGRSLGFEEEQRLRKYSSSIIVKGARSPERLLDEVTLFLHQVESELPAEGRELLRQARHREAAFEGRTILVVEDDVRNVFALTSVLEPKGARVAIARNGKEALTALEKEPRVDLVLMDVMMPEMDGLEATRAIRKNPQWTKLPIIALTAKAMRDDQERCLAAGANDYLAKPLDVEMLLSLLRVWMPRT